MDSILYLPLMLVVGSVALLAFVSLAVALVVHVVRRVTLPKRVVVPQDWMPFEQRRFYNPGSLLRVVAALVLSVILVGGAVVGPFVLGLER